MCAVLHRACSLIHRCKKTCHGRLLGYNRQGHGCQNCSVLLGRLLSAGDASGRRVENEYFFFSPFPLAPKHGALSGI